MNPFEDLIHDLGNQMGVPLKADSHQSCKLTFPAQQITLQIDLDVNADQIIVGTQLARIPAGSYRERIFRQALRVNGSSVSPRGILAYSEKNDTLVLFQFLPLAFLDGKKLFSFLQLYLEHARAWKEALDHGDIPQIQEDAETGGSGMFGLR